MALEQELQTLERFYKAELNAAKPRIEKNGKENYSLFAQHHKQQAEDLKKLFDFFKFNAGALKNCKECGAVMVSTGSKSFCNDKCRMAYNYKKSKKHKGENGKKDITG